MRLQVSNIPYNMMCEIDGCTNNAQFAFDAESARPAGRLHLCRECWNELVRLDRAQKAKGNVVRSEKGGK